MGCSLYDRSFLKYYNLVKKNEFESYEKLRKYQEGKLRELIHFAYENVPYYRKLFNNLSLKPVDIESIKDLEKLPILTKDIIRNNRKDFIPYNLDKQRYVNKSTGGSTGNPLQYRLSKSDRTLGFAILCANWGYAGYELGDKIGAIAGSALISTTRSVLQDNLKAFILNRKIFSSFDMSDEYMNEILIKLNRFKPKYLWGYASSIYLFAKHIRNNSLRINFNLDGVFTTAETLHDYQRKIIEDTFSCEVFNQYGLNDCGVSAYECRMHQGLHIDMIRSILEVVDDDGNQLGAGEEGRILGTSLHNFAMPFIRYDTGDLGILSAKKCPCGRESPLLKKIVGRVSDFIYAPNGNKIHGEFFSHIFYEFDWVKQFQIVQKRIDEIIIRIVPDSKDRVNDSDLGRLRKIIISRTGRVDITIEICDDIEPTKAGKWRFIVREIE